MASLQGLVAECPTCKAVVAIDAPECPQCGELFETESPTGATASPSTASAEDSANDDDEVKERTGFREKFLFYIGIFLILLGGPGIALGSWLHDMLRISVGEFTAFDLRTFRWRRGRCTRPRSKISDGKATDWRGSRTSWSSSPGRRSGTRSRSASRRSTDAWRSEKSSANDVAPVRGSRGAAERQLAQGYSELRKP